MSRVGGMLDGMKTDAVCLAYKAKTPGNVVDSLVGLEARLGHLARPQILGRRRPFGRDCPTACASPGGDAARGERHSSVCPEAAREARGCFQSRQFGIARTDASRLAASFHSAVTGELRSASVMARIASRLMSARFSSPSQWVSEGGDVDAPSRIGTTCGRSPWRWSMSPSVTPKNVATLARCRFWIRPPASHLLIVVAVVPNSSATDRWVLAPRSSRSRRARNASTPPLWRISLPETTETLYAQCRPTVPEPCANQRWATPFASRIAQRCPAGRHPCAKVTWNVTHRVAFAPKVTRMSFPRCVVITNVDRLTTTGTPSNRIGCTIDLRGRVGGLRSFSESVS